ncbi:MAG: aspartate aminotransferase family protein [Alphaproteobacteria bacterium]
MDQREALRLTRAHESTAANTFRLVPDPPVFVRGDGPWLFTADATRYLDLVCGSATTSLGHAHPAHLSAVQQALATGILHTGTRLPSPFRAELYDRLQAILPPGLTRIQLVNSGAEAVEAAIKAAQYATGRSRLVAFEGGYHGRTLGALSLTSGTRIRAPFQLFEANIDILPYPGPNATTDQALAAADALFTACAAANDLPALVLVEAIQAVSGLVPAGPAFLRGLSDLCRSHDIPLALDEIWNGIGRTGHWFGFTASEITPDLVILGKALSGGLPLSAVAAGERFLGQWSSGMHTSTFQGNPLACAMAVATLETIRNHDLLTHVRQVIEPLLISALMPLRGHPGVADVRIAGAQAAISFCTPDGQPDPARAQSLQRAMLDQQALVYGGGKSGECLMLVPPLNLDAEPLSKALADLVMLIDAKEHDIHLG